MQLTVVGIGLIGGSFARAARSHRMFDRITGVDPDPERRRQALALGLVDAALESVPEDSDAVLLAGPSHTIAPWVCRLKDHRAVIFDSGSVKAAVVDAVRATLGRLPAGFVPCHPLAGSEQSGPQAADGGLFEGAQLIVTPEPETDPQALARVEDWWRRLGARVLRMDAGEHDRVLARTSHLPHLLAFAYLHVVKDEHLEQAARGFKDFTRIGAADARVWAPIFRLNRQALSAALDDLERELERARALLESDDGSELIGFIESAARRRRELEHGH